ncbi:MAG TPA: hypothetical protein VM286_10375 [Candidatus Thermoplasmatota archaeon]|nr:hypothetical protein [Candidatus Thermoplasmatota archaeon]
MARPGTLACSCCRDRRVWAEVPADGPRYLEGKQCFRQACPTCGGPCRGTYKLG